MRVNTWRIEKVKKKPKKILKNLLGEQKNGAKFKNIVDDKHLASSFYFNNKRFDVSLLKMLDNDEFYNFVSYLDTIVSKKILFTCSADKLYLSFIFAISFSKSLLSI